MAFYYLSAQVRLLPRHNLTSHLRLGSHTRPVRGRTRRWSHWRFSIFRTQKFQMDAQRGFRRWAVFLTTYQIRRFNVCVGQASQGHRVAGSQLCGSLVLLILYSWYFLPASVFLLPWLAFIFWSLFLPGGKHVPAVWKTTPSTRRASGSGSSHSPQKKS